MERVELGNSGVIKAQRFPVTGGEIVHLPCDLNFNVETYGRSFKFSSLSNNYNESLIESNVGLTEIYNSMKERGILSDIKWGDRYYLYIDESVFSNKVLNCGILEINENKSFGGIYEVQLESEIFKVDGRAGGLYERQRLAERKHDMAYPFLIFEIWENEGYIQLREQTQFFVNWYGRTYDMEDLLHKLRKPKYDADYNTNGKIIVI